MKLYKVTSTGYKTHWLSSATEASKKITELSKEARRPRTMYNREEVEVPTNKVGLLEWLNVNATM
jgi:ribosomal protein S26